MPKLTAKTVIANGIILVITLAVSLVAAEGVLRVKNASVDSYDIEMWRYSGEMKERSENPVLGHEHVGSTSAVLQSVGIRTNEWGLRGPPVKPPGTFERRILVLGSSVTLGWGVPEERTLTAKLRGMFERDGRTVEVLNGGIGNYNTVRSVELFMTKLKDLVPTDIVVHYFVNDAEVLEPGGGNFLLRHSQLAVTLWSVASRLFRPSGEMALEEHYRRVYRPESPGFQAMGRALGRLAEYARANDVRVILAMTPDVHNLSDYRLGFIHEIMADVAAQYGFTYVDLLPSMVGLTSEELWATPGDPHPNALGHQVMADALYPVLAAPQ